MSYEIKRIQELCRERDWTSYKLAKAMNTSPPNVYNLMYRSSTPSVDTLKKVCEAFGITMEQFYHDDESTCVASPQQVEVLKKYLNLTLEKRKMVEAYMDGLISH